MICMNLFIVTVCSLFFIYVAADHLLIIFIGVVLLFAQVGSYMTTALINPGIPDRNKDSYDELYIQRIKNDHHKYCHLCETVLTPNTETVHCEDCGVCVEGYDHHCPWTSKCIGKGNIKYFYTFIGMTMALAVYVIIITALFLHPQLDS